MPQFPLFLSAIVVVRNQAVELADMLASLGEKLAGLAATYEIIVVDNASTDDSVEVLRALAGVAGQPDLQIYALNKEVDVDSAAWVGLEGALGDFALVLDAAEDPPTAVTAAFLATMLARATSGADVVFARNLSQPAMPPVYRLGHNLFHACYRRLHGVHLAREAPRFRLLSKRVVHFVLQHPQPALTYRHLPATAGFARAHLTYQSLPGAQACRRALRLGEALDRGLRLLVSTTRAPLRAATALCVFGATANLVYSVYVVAVALLKPNVAPGWTSSSLQQSGMFFLLSVVLLVLGEYLVQVVALTTQGPTTFVRDEFTSKRLRRREVLNVLQAGAGTDGAFAATAAPKAGARVHGARTETPPAAGARPAVGPSL